MPPRSRARRSVAKVDTPEELTPEVEPSPRGRTTRGRRVKAEPEVQDDEDEDAEGEDEEDEEEVIPEPGPSRRARTSRGRGAAGKGRGRKSVNAIKDEDGDGTDEGDEIEVAPEPATPSKRMRARKSVSYKEVVPEIEDDVVDEDDDVDAEGEVDEDVDGEGEDEPEVPSSRKRSARAGSNATPSRSKVVKPVLEKIGSGRGGFSVKGAAAAAARARWDKVRREKAERGEESDDDRPARRRAGGGGGGGGGSRRHQTKATDETVEMGSNITIKGKEYTMGDDELVLPDNEKGDAKVDAEGRLLGGREYKLVTFTSESRRNPKKVYALTIDAARACGYTDSLAFLRRCPQIIKLACAAEERQMLIDIGRVTGNLKHRMVTMVAMRNIFKVMGARVIKGGKWVTDDYDEEEALVKCAENGFTPYTEAHEEEILANAVTAASQPKSGLWGDGTQRPAANLAPFYTLGGPTTTFGGNGVDPWSEAGWGNKRAKLRGLGITENDWMLRTAEDCRRIDQRLKDFRTEGLSLLEGVDATRGWVYALENASDELDKKEDQASLGLPSVVERKKSTLSQVEGVDEDALTPLPGSVVEDGETGADGGVNGDGDVAMQNGNGDQLEVLTAQPEGGKIIVQTAREEASGSAKWSWGLGSWRPGSILAAYEPHTHMPHIPLWTQPHIATRERISPYPLLASYSDSAHKNFVQSSASGKSAIGLSSVEYVIERQPHNSAQNGEAVAEWEQHLTRDEAREKRSREVQDALEWETASKKRRKATGGVGVAA